MKEEKEAEEILVGWQLLLVLSKVGVCLVNLPNKHVNFILKQDAVLRFSPIKSKKTCHL